MKTMILMALFAGFQAQAGIKAFQGKVTKDNPDYKEMYVTESGSKVAPNEAFMSVMQGQTVYQCVVVEATMGKTGLSAGLHKAKKKI